MRTSKLKKNLLLPRSHVIASFEEEKRNEILSMMRKLAPKVDGFFFRKPVILNEGLAILSEARKIVEKKGLECVLIPDVRLDHRDTTPDEIRSISAIVERHGGYAITVYAVSAFHDFIDLCSRESKVKVLPIIDLGEEYARHDFPDQSVVRMAEISAGSRCPAVIMSGRNADRIRRVKNAGIGGLRILAYLEPSVPKGIALESGADFEIIPGNSKWT